MIICFTGTGNSLQVARMLADALGDAIEMIPSAPGLTPPAGERLIWVFPVYSWGVPPVVLRQMKAMADAAFAGREHYCVMTCGDDAGLTDSMWRRAIQRRGGADMGIWSVQMPNTYVLMKGFDTDPDDVARRKLEHAPGRVAEIAKRIAARGRETDVVAGGWAWVKTRIIYPWFVRFAMSPRPFHPNEGCVGCRKCAESCPLGNITMTAAGTPAWGRDCALCLRCYHVCPRHAVVYGKATSGKGQYLNPIFHRRRGS